MTTVNAFSAPDPALGYLYQVRSALLWALERLKTDEPFLVSIETLDDVTFETMGGDVTDLLQTKHHRTKVASLTDYSVDLWKSLRVWLEGYSSGAITGGARLHLVTTSYAAAGSAASKLRAADRDVTAARKALDDVAASSTSEENRKAYGAYLKIDPVARESLLSRVLIFDAAKVIADLDDRLRHEVYWAAPKQHLSAFLERVEGWWFRRVVQQLSEGPQARIGSVEIEARMSALREQFKEDSLPIDEDLLDAIIDEATVSSHSTFPFVRQIELTNAGTRRVVAAIRAYYRAFHQRSRWMRQELIGGLDLQQYERRLIEEWELVFAQVSDELGEAETEQIKQVAARKVLAWAEQAAIPIRPNVTEPFVCRGSLHLLADEGRIGWHAEFRERLSELFESTGASA